MPPLLNRRLIDRFFKALADELNHKATVIVTGAAAGNLLGEVRPSRDVDFAIRFSATNPISWDRVETAVNKAIEKTGIQANYAEDIDRWGLISLMDYPKHTCAYKRFGALDVEILSPTYWSIGKMSRFLQPDVKDMIRVFKKQNIHSNKLARVWGLALKKSPKSTALYQFRIHVEYFIKHYGKTIWGKKFDPDPAIRLFHKTAGASV